MESAGGQSSECRRGRRSSVGLRGWERIQGLESETHRISGFLEANVLMAHTDPGRHGGQDGSPEATLVFTKG